MTKFQSWVINFALGAALLVVVCMAAIGLTDVALDFDAVLAGDFTLLTATIMVLAWLGVIALQLAGFIGAERTQAAWEEKRFHACALGGVFMALIICSSGYFGHKGWDILFTMTDADARAERRDRLVVEDEFAKASRDLEMVNQIRDPALMTSPEGVELIQSTMTMLGQDVGAIDGAAGQRTIAGVTTVIDEVDKRWFRLKAELRAIDSAAESARERALITWVLAVLFELLVNFGRVWLVSHRSAGRQPSQEPQTEVGLTIRSLEPGCGPVKDGVMQYLKGATWPKGPDGLPMYRAPEGFHACTARGGRFVMLRKNRSTKAA